MNRQYTFSLPDNVGQVIDALPKTKKSEFVAKAVQNQVEMEAKQKALDVIALLKPLKTNTHKDAVDLVKEVRTVRAKQILSNSKN